jgi:hypothetical protein
MTEDKDLIKNLEYLDKTLTYLIHECKSYATTFNSLYFHFYQRNLDTDNKFNALGYYTSIKNGSNNFEDFLLNYSAPDNTQAQGQKLVESCYYLMKHDYIRLDEHLNIKITFEGIMKFSEGFVSMHHKNLSDSARLKLIAETQLTQNGQILIANQKIASLTCWIAVGAVVAVIYQVVELLKLLFSYWFCNL